MPNHSVYKYAVPQADEFELVLPEGAEILHVQPQRDVVAVWALVQTDPGTPRERRRFRVFNTGVEIEHPRTLAYVATYHLHGGVIVKHLFEVLPTVVEA